MVIGILRKIIGIIILTWKYDLPKGDQFSTGVIFSCVGGSLNNGQGHFLKLKIDR